MTLPALLLNTRKLPPHLFVLLNQERNDVLETGQALLLALAVLCKQSFIPVRFGSGIMEMHRRLLNGLSIEMSYRA